MKRAKPALSAIALAMALAAIVYGTHSRQPPLAFKPPPVATAESVQPASGDVRADGSANLTPQPATNGGRKDDDDPAPVKERARRDTGLDEADARKWVREETSREVREDYSLLLEHLDLSSSEEQALLELLIEDAIANTKTPYSDGIGMGEHERSAKIADIVGDTKRQRFLALERNLGEYTEVQRVQSILKQKDVPLTDTQRDQLLEIFVDTRAQVDMQRPAHMRPNTIESLEYTLAQLNEHERLTLELVTDVLSAEQIEYLFDRYQARSYRRADALELHRQRLADNPNDDLLLGYPSPRD